MSKSAGRLTEEQALQIIALGTTDMLTSEIAKAFNISRHSVQAILRGTTWAHLPRPDRLARPVGKYPRRPRAPVNLDDYERLIRAKINYDPDSGTLTFRHHRIAAMAGTVAVSKSSRGYVSVRIKKRRFPAHRIAWFLTHGRWPEFQIDHINGDPADNRLANLREATGQQNMWNRARPRAGNPYRGASFNKASGKWVANIRADGKQKFLGSFSTPEAAHAAYCAEAARQRGEFARFD